MTPAATFADLEGLLDLVDGNAADMCARLLRTLTDLYLQRPTHTPEDEHYYTELALRLIDAAALSERAALAARLAFHPSAPRPVLERLARDAIEAAGPILAHSPHLRWPERESIAEEPTGIDAESIGTEPSAARPATHGAGPVAAASELSEVFYRATAPERPIDPDQSPLCTVLPIALFAGSARHGYLAPGSGCTSAQPADAHPGTQTPPQRLRGASVAHPL
jgi:hypothetical protein